jgi:hypothetical protein
MPSPSGSELKLTQNAKPEVVLELVDDTILLTELFDDELDASTELDSAELAAEVAGVGLLPPPPPPPHPTKHPTNKKPKRDLFKYIVILLKIIV